jgi:hypothetical protein
MMPWTAPLLQAVNMTRSGLPLKMLVAGVLMLACPGPMTAAASDALGDFKSFGLGGERCLTFTTVLANQDAPVAQQNAMSFQFWIGGHLSGLNSWVPGAKNFLDPLTVEQATAWLNQYCREHPDNTMDQAVTNFELMLMQQHGAAPPRTYAPLPIR